MARKIIDIGIIGNDGTGDSIRDSFRKVNDNFRELYSSLGLGERLSFTGLDDTPDDYFGLVDPENGNTPILTVNNDASGIMFKRIVEGVGISLDFETNPDQISISTRFSNISDDTSPSLGGPLRTFIPGEAGSFPILDLQTPTAPDQAANKQYTDTKISRAGVNAIDPASGTVNQAFGRMTGPLVLSRDPIPEDDIVYDGLTAATKRYVDNAAFGSVANLFVATSGQDDRPGVDPSLQGRALAYAYRTFEAALKRAEELLLDSRFEIGPYKKLLTYDNGAEFCTLTKKDVSPFSGSGFSGKALMTVDEIVINNVGTNYAVGDILTLEGGTVAVGGQPCRIEVLSTTTTPGAIATYKILSGGLYVDVLPGSVGVTTSDNSAFGTGATFNVTYKVNNVTINPGGGGSGFSLVSVRIEPQITDTTGSGAFATAEVSGGIIVSVTVTDQGSGFTQIPTVVANLPRFFIFTNNLRTDFTGDVTTETPEAFRGRDIREGLYLYGETSGALAQILSHTGELDSDGNELFDVDIKYGSFEDGEAISYGDVTKNVQITIFVESGIYEEDLPLKLPQNVAIVGDEFRRVIIRPRPGVSASPWAFQKFRRDLTIGSAASGDLLTIADRLYGYHYLDDSSKPVYPKIDNGGDRKSAAAILRLNRQFLQEELIEWIAEQIRVAPIGGTWRNFVYDERICKRDAGLIIDAMIFDLKWGGYDRTVSAALKYYQNASGRFAISADGPEGQLEQTQAALDYLETMILSVVANIEITPKYNTIYDQIIDAAFIAEVGTSNVVGYLFDVIEDIISASGGGSGLVNFPKENDRMDVFLCNDATILRSVTGQGHGGFMMVLDPTGQVLAKSPYAQECASFSKSKNAQTFAGGQFVDGFAGNLQFRHAGTVAGTGNTRIEVTNLERLPNLPASFIVDDSVFRVNYIRDYIYNSAGSTATFVLDETSPFARAPGAQTCTIANGDPTIITRVDHRLQAGSTIIFSVAGGSLPAGLTAGTEYFVLRENLTTNTFRISASPISSTPVATTTAGSGTFSYQRIYELLMPGNRSMLSNDFTQINDLGYGLITTNGGLIEAVSMFTYYCHISYYSVNGGQIRSVGGSSAHGNYALVAQGSDPLEVPTPCALYYDFSQRVYCYYPGPAYANTVNGLFVYVYGYNHVPLSNSELEVDHGGVIYRYPITSAAEEENPDPVLGSVSRLNLTSDETGNFDGLFASIPNGTIMTIRQNSQIILTGNLVDVAVRPSTGLGFNESTEIYRVLQFEDYTDPNGPYDVTISNGSPAVITIKLTITDIATNVCTTDSNHNLRVGDKFIPDSSSNNLVSGTTYYVKTIPAYNQFTLSTAPGGSTFVLTNGSGLTIVGTRSHLFQAGFQITFTTAGTLPSPLVGEVPYYVAESGLTDTQFSLSETRSGATIDTTTAGSGTHVLDLYGLTRTSLRENYNYVDLTLWQPGEFQTSGQTCTISIADPAIISCTGHGFSIGDVIKFETTGSLPGGISENRNYHVISDGFGVNSFQISVSPNVISGRIPVATAGTQSGVHTVGKVKGEVGENTLAVVPVGPADETRIPGSKFYFLGKEYIIDTYQNQSTTNEPYARVILNKGLEDNIVKYVSSYTIKAGVPIRTNGADGDLTIRISLTRVTSHDLLEIGTGSYADTNYPNEIYGPPVNGINEANETEERDVGRVFYVTTDQFGNFNVGPYFRVDQGTGRVTFSAAIALSNLDGIGFKRGVPIAEFSTDSGFTDNATDTVPTENATRIYIERRLGLTHAGALVVDSQLLPPVSGGFMALDGQLAMKADMSLGNHKIINVADPTDPTDAVNLRSLTISNFTEFDISDVDAADVFVFRGDGQIAINATVTGDITLSLDSTARTVVADINPGVVTNTEIGSAANIEQSKLNMNSAGTRANATGITQADKGLSSFDSAQFNATDGWITVKNNGISVGKLAQIASETVIGNATGSSATPSEVLFDDVVNLGGAVKKSQYTGVGFLRRYNPTSNTGDAADYTIVDMKSTWASAADDGTLVSRGASGLVSSNIIRATTRFDIDTQPAIDTALQSSGGYIRYRGWGSNNSGIYAQYGTSPGDRRNLYWNDAHLFKDSTGNFDAPITCSSVQTLALTTGGNTTAGTITGRWTLTGTSPNESRLQATYSADLAENYEGDKEYEVGTVLVFGGDKEVTVTNTKGDTRVAGVVSNTAAFAMYEACPGLKNLVALQGRVPCKVVGKIKKGDILITAAIPGVAIAATGDVKVGTVVGKALTDYDSDHIGMIEIAVGRT